MPNPPVHDRASTTAARPSTFAITPHADLSPEEVFRQILDSMTRLNNKMDNVLLRLTHIERNIQSTQREVTHLRTAVETLNGQNKDQNPPPDFLPRRS